MTQRIVRLFLALAVAFVFTGRVEAAAQHCARLAQAEQAAAPTETVAEMFCHEEGSSETTVPQPAHHEQAADPCECIAVLKACSAPIETTASTHIEPYTWTEPEAISFASVEPAPNFRPPRS